MGGHGLLRSPKVRVLCCYCFFPSYLNQKKHPRLKANDRVDPYVAVYEPLAPSHIGDVTCITWTGFLHPSFIQHTLDTVTLDNLKARSLFESY